MVKHWLISKTCFHGSLATFWVYQVIDFCEFGKNFKQIHIIVKGHIVQLYKEVENKIKLLDNFFHTNLLLVLNLFQNFHTSLYIWSVHYARSAWGWGLFDHQKQTVVRGCFRVVRGCFCWPFSLFVTFCYFLLLFLLLVTLVNYFFTVEGSLFVTFCYFFYCL